MTLAGHKVRFAEQEKAPLNPGFSIYDAVAVISLSPVGCEIRGVISLEPHAGYVNKLKDVMRIAGVAMTI